MLRSRNSCFGRPILLYYNRENTPQGTCYSRQSRSIRCFLLSNGRKCSRIHPYRFCGWPPVSHRGMPRDMPWEPAMALMENTAEALSRDFPIEASRRFMWQRPCDTTCVATRETAKYDGDNNDYYPGVGNRGYLILQVLLFTVQKYLACGAVGRTRVRISFRTCILQNIGLRVRP